jgi:type IV secretory pathway TrbD component
MPDRPKRVAMEASNGEQRVKVEIGRRTGNLTIEEPSTLTEGIRAKIQEICDGSLMDALAAGRTVNLWTLGMVIPVICVLILGELKVLPYSAAYFGTVTWFVAWFSAGILIFRFREKSDILIINVYRADRPSFFRRTKDDWVVEISVMIVGLILGYIIGRVTKR